MVGDGVGDGRIDRRHGQVAVGHGELIVRHRHIVARGIVGAIARAVAETTEGDGGPADVVARTAVGEGGRGAGGDAVAEGQGVGAGGGVCHPKAIPSYGIIICRRVVVAVGDDAISRTTNCTAYRSFVILAVSATRFERGIDDVAVLYRAGLYRANDSAGIFATLAIVIGSDIGIDHRKIPDAASLKMAEQSCVWRRGVYGEAGDGVALSVVGAVEWRGVVTVGLAANRLEVADAAHVDVLRLLEGHAAGFVAVVDIIGEDNEVLRVADFVITASRVVRQAADGILCPRRLRGEQGEEQHGGCPRGVSDDVNDVVHCCLMFYCYTLLL